MCKYCEKIAAQTKSLPSIALYERAEGESESKFRIGCSIAGLGTNYWFFGEVNDGCHDIEIYYCPFCGRKLKEEK